MVHLALYQPRIPHNVGALLRLCACWNVPLECIGPFPFLWTDKHLKRSGLDYICKSTYHIHTQWSEYLTASGPKRRIGLVPRKGQSFLDYSFHKGDHLIAGSEDTGLPVDIENQLDDCIFIPMRSDCRSLNLSMSCAIVLTEVLRQLKEFPSYSSLSMKNFEKT